MVVRGSANSSVGKVLLDGICTVAPQIGAQDSCLLHGRLLKEQNAAAFDMNDIETITEAE